MKTHPYLRAYMAGVVVPNVALLVAITALFVTRLIYRFSIPVERVIVFPMSLAPNLFGLWNILYVWFWPRRHLPIGLHGDLLPFLVLLIAISISASLRFFVVNYRV